MHFCLEVLPILPFIMMSVNSLGYGSALQMCQMKLFFLGSIPIVLFLDHLLLCNFAVWLG